MNQPTTAVNKSVKYNTILYTVLFVVIPGCVMYTLVDYFNYGLGRYVIIDIINLLVILFGYVLYKLEIITKKAMMVNTVYSLVVALGVTLIASIGDTSFEFESFFLTTEMLLILLIFAIGLFVHLESILIITVFNVFFIIVSSLTSGKEFPIEKYIFYAVVVIGAGITAYFGQKAVVNLYKKIKEANILVNVQNEELKAINHSKDQLFKIIGHDLKTPFHQLSGLVEVLENLDSKEEREEFAGLIKQSVNKGATLLEDLLKWGTNSNNHTSVNLKKQKISPVIERAFEFCNLSATKKDIVLTNMVAADFKVTINEMMLETVLRNIIANAIKFSYRNSEITIHSEQNASVKSIIVSDTGVGMKPKKLENLFDNPILTTTRGTENEPGNGFGLNIAKKLVEKQNGEMEVQSTFGEGTSIYLRFRE